LPADFEELQPAAVDSVHGSADLADSLLPSADAVTGAFESDPLPTDQGRLPSVDSAPYVRGPVAQINDSQRDEIAAPRPAAELSSHADSASARLGAAPSSNGEATHDLASGSSGSGLEQHPASGSLFMPYLVTEIPDLRKRCARKRSWWRRLFG
jgi:hypothetical protein